MSAVTRLVVGYCQENTYLVYDANGRALMIDPGDEAQRLLAWLDETQVQVEAIVLTHAHFDHIMAVKAVQEATGAPLLIHEADARVLNNSAYTLIDLPYTLTPDRLLKDGDTVTMGDEVFEVLHTPGHTEGSICLLSGTLLFAGDTLFAGSVGRVDLPGADVRKQRESLGRLAALPDAVRVFSGHGEETTIGHEKRNNPFMVGL